MAKTINIEPNWSNVYKFVMAMTPKDRDKFIKSIGKSEWDKLKGVAGIDEEVKEKKKKEKLDEGIIMMSGLTPVMGPKLTLSMRGNKQDNFEFKGLPGQFDKDGKKIMDEYGQPISSEESKPGDYDYEGELNEAKKNKSYKIWSDDIVRITKRELDEITYLLEKSDYDIDEDEYTAIFLRKIKASLDSPGVTKKGKALNRSQLKYVFF